MCIRDSSHLRKRGGSLADLAILVIDINEGIKPQTAEVIEILKLNKTPFIVALNKIDNISGWRKQSEDLKENLSLQSINTQNQYQEKLLTLIGSLYHHGFNAKPFYEVTDFASQLALVPCSGKTGEGIPELLMVLCGLSQKFLKKGLELGEKARGVVLEMKKEKSMQFLEAILHDGRLKVNNEIAISSFNEPVLTKIRVLEEIQPTSSKFKPSPEVKAATGIRMQLTNSENILPGMPFTIFENNLKEIKKEFKQQTSSIKTDSKGIIIKADSLGPLEALITMLKQEKIPIISAGIGPITKKEVILAQTNLREDPVNAIILGFNVEEDEEAKELAGNIKIIKDEIIYKLIENLLEYQNEKRNEIKREKLMSLSNICKLNIFHQFVFRNSNPAIFGVSVEGTLKANTPLMNENGESIARVKVIQDKGSKLQEAKTGMEVAISLPNITFERKLNESKELYSDLSEYQYREFKKNKEILTQEEVKILQKIAQIKRKQKQTWGV